MPARRDQERIGRLTAGPAALAIDPAIRPPVIDLVGVGSAGLTFLSGLYGHPVARAPKERR